MVKMDNEVKEWTDKENIEIERKWKEIRIDLTNTTGVTLPEGVEKLLKQVFQVGWQLGSIYTIERTIEELK